MNILAWSQMTYTNPTSRAMIIDIKCDNKLVYKLTFLTPDLSKQKFADDLGCFLSQIHKMAGAQDPVVNYATR